MSDYDVFISYSSKDKSIVHALAERLKEDGLRVWLDVWVIKPGDSIPLKINQGLESSNTVLVCMSPAYFGSDWGWAEHLTQLFDDPTNKKRRLIPLLIADCTRPKIIAHLSYIDWRMLSDEAYDKIYAYCLEKNSELFSTNLNSGVQLNDFRYRPDNKDRFVDQKQKEEARTREVKEALEREQLEDEKATVKREELRKQKEEVERKQKEEVERKQKEEAERKRKEEDKRKEKEAWERKQKEEEGEKASKENGGNKQKDPPKKPRSSSRKGILVFSIIFGVFLVGAAVIYLGSNISSHESAQGSIPTSAQSNVSSKIYAYIVNSNSSSVSVIDTITNTVTATIDFEDNMWERKTYPFAVAVAVTQDGKKIYVLPGPYDKRIFVIEAATNKVTAKVKLSEPATDIAATPDGKKVYTVSNIGNVNAIDTATNNIEADKGYYGTGYFKSIAIAPDGKKYVIGKSDHIGNSSLDPIIYVLSPSPYAYVEHELNLGGEIRRVAVSPDGKKVYVTNCESNNVSVIDTATNTVTTTVEVGKYPYGVAVSPDGKKVYVTNYGVNTVSVIDTTTNKVAATINVGSYPTGVAVTPDGKKVYVTNEGIYADPGNTVSVIDTTTNSVISTVPVGQLPMGIAIG